MMGIMRGKRRRIQLATKPGLINRELDEEMDFIGNKAAGGVH
jgi:hypothetical protein